MQPPKRILVPVDFSEPSRAALNYATMIGKQFGADIDVLHVWQPPADTESRSELLSEFARSAAGHEMISWLAPFLEECDVHARGRLAPGDAWEVPDAIVETARIGEYDLVVMGTEGNATMLNLLKRSVSEKVMRRSPCPVVTVRADSPSMRITQDDFDMTSSCSLPS